MKRRNNTPSKDANGLTEMKVRTSKVFNRLVAVSEKLKRAKAGYRATLLQSLADAASEVRILKSNSVARERFREKLAQQHADGAGRPNIRLSQSVVELVFDSKNRTARQRANKFAIVLDYLDTKGIPPSRIAKEVRGRGGIEKIYQSVVRDEKTVLAKTTTSEKRSLNGEIPSRNSNNRDVLVGAYIKLADRDRLLELPIGKSFQISARRLGQPKAEIEIFEVL